MEIYSLSKLNKLIAAALKYAFPQLVWLEAEISRVYEKNGHFYLELVEKKNTQILAKSSAVIWRNNSYVIRQKLRGKFDDLIQVGIHIKILVDIDYHPVYGHKLIVHDLDPEFTLGQMELQRKRILQQLKNEGLLEKNKQLLLPRALSHIAVISSRSAAGYSDFLNQLRNNRYQYDFNIELFHASMQGLNLKKEVIDALREIQRQEKWDMICIVRGGGSRVDLAWFDDYEIAVEIAHCKIPVLTGIGHEIDSSVADFVAHTPVKTPTAAAEFILQHNAAFEQEIENIVFDIYRLSIDNLDDKTKRLKDAEQLLYLYSKSVLEQARHKLQLYSSELKNTLLLNLERQGQALDKIELILEAVSPRAVLKKGYAIVKQNGNIVSHADIIDREKALYIQFYDSEIIIEP